MPACLLLAVAVLLAACTGLPVKEASDALRSKQVCCKNYSDVTYIPIKQGIRQKFDISMDSPVMELNYRRPVYFLPLKLPSATRSLNIQTMESEYLPKTSYLDPAITILDNQFKELSTQVSLPLQRGKHVILPGLWEWNFNTTIDLPQEAAYVIIYGDPRSKRVRQAVSENGTPWPIPPSPIGSIAVVPQ